MFPNGGSVHSPLTAGCVGLTMSRIRTSTHSKRGHAVGYVVDTGRVKSPDMLNWYNYVTHNISDIVTYCFLRQGGTTGTDVMRAAAMGGHGSVVLAGTTNGLRPTPRDKRDVVTAVNLHEQGTEVWRWQVIGRCDIDIRRTIRPTPPLLAPPRTPLIPSSFRVFFRLNRVAPPKLYMISLQPLRQDSTAGWSWPNPLQEPGQKKILRNTTSPL